MMNKLAFMAGCILLTGCNLTSDEVATKGVVVDATMNTVAIAVANNDTLLFSTINADKASLDGLLIGDSVEVRFKGEYKPNIEALSLATVTKVSDGNDDYARIFNGGIRLGSVDGEGSSLYVCFSRDSAYAELVSPENSVKEILEQRTLPSGEHVWNIEDDDTKNLRRIDDCWTVSRRGKLLFKQAQSDNDSSLGDWEELHFKGTLPAADCPGIKYELLIRHREHSGDGYFLLRQTYIEAENGKDVVYSYIGRRYTQRGISSNSDATVWQLQSDNGGDVYNFLYDSRQQTLTLLNDEFEIIDSGLNYTITKVD